MNKKAWIVFAIIVISLLGSMVYLSNSKKLNIDDITKDQHSRIIGSEKRNGEISDHVRGNKDAKVTVIEYGDYECGPCKSFESTIDDLHNRYKDRVAFVYRNFPIASSHPNARAAAATVEAAGLQGKYWEMHSLIYDRQDDWSKAQPKDRSSIFLQYAKQMGLDIDKFNKDIAKDEITKKIDFDIALGNKHGVDATPTIFVNGEKLNLKTTSDLEEAIKKYLQ